MSWNTIKDFYESQGEINIQGSKDAFRLAFKRGLISTGEIWMNMVQDRALTVHSYDQKIAKKVIEVIFNQYAPLFVKLKIDLLKIKEQGS